MIISTQSDAVSNGTLALSEASDPQPGDFDVVINVAGAGVNRADLLQAAGHYPPPPGAPSWPGLEVSGTVASVGAKVSKHRPGDRVVALLAGGGYAEQVAVHEDLALALPEGLDLVAAGGLMEAACTVWSNLQAADARAGQSMLVHGGSGGVGSLAIQIGKARGLKVVSTAGGPERAARCQELGADLALDYRSDDVVARIQEGGRVDIVLDVLGAGALDANLRCLATGGALVIIGLQRGARGEINLGRMLASRLRVIGTTLRSRPHDEKAAIVEAVRQHVWPLVPGHVSPVIHTTYPLAQAQEAHDALAAGDVFGKLVLTP
ncbi:NAD(P)H-quinone oxidoreductase [Demequina flava]|uniref:NAD(P)H-quinone oxidoreductase n=1 Tax=Demequina flava TaxID=1095025 RepID=UPI000782E057|nr:NAD(P)H-quinone oxidoreductase [Demequina flava]